MHERKHTHRQRLTKSRKAIADVAMQSVSQTICERTFAAIDWSLVRSVCTYTAIPDSGEIDPTSLLLMLAALPNPPAITTVGSHPNARFPEGHFDIIIVPVLGFDSDNHRLGQGGGWYDQFLATQPQARTIGLAHAHAQITFPHEAHDIPLDLIITEQS